MFSKERGSRARRLLGLESLESRLVLSASPLPVLMVLPNTDFYYRDEFAGMLADKTLTRLSTAWSRDDVAARSSASVVSRLSL